MKPDYLFMLEENINHNFLLLLTLQSLITTHHFISFYSTSSHPEVLCKIAVLKISENSYQRTSVNFENFLRSPFLMEHLWWLPLLHVLILGITFSKPTLLVN